MAESWMRSGTLLVKSIAITTMGGMLVGSTCFLVIMASLDGKFSDLLGLPFTLFLSMPIAVPFGVVCGSLAAGCLEILLRSPFRTSSRQAWMALGGTVGLALGALCPFFLNAAGFNIHGVRDVAIFGGPAVGAGLCCGLVLGWLGWAEGKDRLGPGRAAPNG